MMAGVSGGMGGVSRNRGECACCSEAPTCGERARLGSCDSASPAVMPRRGQRPVTRARSNEISSLFVVRILAWSLSRPQSSFQGFDVGSIPDHATGNARGVEALEYRCDERHGHGLPGTAGVDDCLATLVRLAAEDAKRAGAAPALSAQRAHRPLRKARRAALTLEFCPSSTV